MPVNLATPFAFPNGSRLVVVSARPSEEESTMTVTIELRTPIATNYIVTERALIIRNGMSDRLSRGTIAANQRFDDSFVYEPKAVSTPTGFTDALDAWRAGATPAARRAALENWMLTSGVIHASLAGS